MTQKEIKDLVSFTSGTKDIFYYSKISRISETEIIYDSKVYAISGEFYNTISAGMQNYEMYKLSMSHNKAKELFEEISDTTINNYLKEKIENVIDMFKQEVNSLITSANTITNKVSSTVQTIEDIQLLENKLHALIDSFDPSSIHQKVESKLDDLKSTKKEFFDEVIPTTKELKHLVATLKEIVQAED